MRGRREQWCGQLEDRLHGSEQLRGGRELLGKSVQYFLRRQRFLQGRRRHQRQYQCDPLFGHEFMQTESGVQRFELPDRMHGVGFLLGWQVLLREQLQLQLNVRHRIEDRSRCALGAGWGEKSYEKLDRCRHLRSCPGR